MNFKRYLFIILSFVLLTLITYGKDLAFKPALVDFDAYETLVKKVKDHRKTRLLNWDDFLAASKESNVIILDARSAAMFNQKHIKGAINLNFSDFTQRNLAKIIPNVNTKVLIYCNNNIEDDESSYPTKQKTTAKKSDNLTLALNIPTYINLYGYGYQNVFELAEMMSVNDERIEFEGTYLKNK